MATQVKDSGKLLYLYGITQPLKKKPGLKAGVDGFSPVESIRCSDLLCWVSRVDTSTFGEQLAGKMENLEWLAEASVRHQQAVAAIHACGSILPTRFGTVFLSEQSLCKDVAHRKKALQAEFEHVADADEWGVRIFAVTKPVAAPATAASGKDYLKQKAATLKERTPRAAGPELGKLAAELEKIARATAPGGKVSAGQRGLEWQGSFLVPRGKEQRFRAVLGRFAEQWQASHRVECTGPWPPYSFVGRGEADGS